MKHKFKVVLRVEELENRSAPANLLHDLSLLTGLPNQQEALPASSTRSAAAASHHVLNTDM